MNGKKLDKQQVNQTLSDLEDLHKSQEAGGEEEVEDCISALEKALTDYEGEEAEGEDLEKSAGEEGEDLEKEVEDEDLEKSETELDIEEVEMELVKASAAYEELRGEVLESMAKSDQRYETLASAMADLTGLVTGIGRAVVLVAKDVPALRKSVDDLTSENEALRKSVEEFGKTPIGGSVASLGTGRDKEAGTEPLTKSQLTTALTAAVRDHGQDQLSGYLSKVSVHGPSVVPEGVISKLKELELLA